MERVMIFKRFERFWHWAQAVLIIVMLCTGFEIHGSWSLLGFQQALWWHETAAWILIVLWIFAIFWHFTTGEWRQYLPTRHNIGAMLQYYLVGIFRDQPHPHHQTVLQKHNPLQRLAYLMLKLVLHPLMWVTGLLMLFYANWSALGIELNRGSVVTLHVLGAFLMLAFLIIHLYLITTGRTIGAHLKAMLTGYDDVESPEKTKSVKS